jgi:DNA-binding NtrC family response regulator
LAQPSSPVILIVEDDLIILMHAASFLGDAGFQTVTASNADAAVLILGARLDIRLVFTDVDMPGSMNGMKLASAVRKRWPPIELIITSGKPGPSAADLPARGLFFSKPYRPNDIIDAARSFSLAA